MEKDIAFVYYLIERKPINLPFLMLSQIQEVAKKSRACLPYGIVFTLIFLEFGINYIGENARRLLHIDKYNECSLHHMGYRKVDDYWICRAFGQGATASGSSDEDDDDDEKEDKET